ncbi:MAG TPA: pitrilysin family protein [Phycisphaerae bacterium]|nr:pitrilysin family protein [Phycisphaerae bacterium]
MMSSFHQHTLSNGLQIVIEVMPHVPSVACGFLVRTGARDDPPDHAGVSHFLEHMCFKGTARRTWQDINVAFDEMGAHYNAYTGKDRTFYFGWVRTEEFERQLDLLADMMRSALPPAEFDMEKKVVLEEIAMSEDDLTSNAYEFLYENVCAGSPLAWPVLGYERTIRDLTRDRMNDYFERRYAPGNLLLIVAGNVDPDHVLETADRLCGSWPPRDPGWNRQPPLLRAGSSTRAMDKFHQQAILLAFPSAGACDPLDESAEALAAILGGQNSRFYWNIVQQGLSPRAGVFREEYHDFGLITLYALCEPENAEKVLDAMQREARLITNQGPEPKETQRVKNLRRTSLATESEAPFYRLGQIADDMEYRGRPRTAEEQLAEVDAVSAETIADYLRRFPITGEGFLAGVGPRQWPSSAS